MRSIAQTVTDLVNDNVTLHDDAPVRVWLWGQDDCPRSGKRWFDRWLCPETTGGSLAGAVGATDACDSKGRASCNLAKRRRPRLGLLAHNPEAFSISTWRVIQGASIGKRLPWRARVAMGYVQSTHAQSAAAWTWSLRDDRSLL